MDIPVAKVAKVQKWNFCHPDVTFAALAIYYI
jgi:hypothetical protein